MREDNLYIKLKPLIEWFVTRVLYPEIINSDLIPANERIIFAGNCIHWYDALILMTLTDRQVCILTKKSLFEGSKGCFLKRLGCIPFDPTGNDVESFREPLVSLVDGKCVGAFLCEQDGLDDDSVLSMKMGTAVIAKRAMVDIIPFTINGGYSLKRKNIQVKFGKRIKVNEYIEEELVKKITM